ncbi:MAG: efflux RND transporter periplasmic adaptor subunit [Rhodospirillaceae bacterium]|jgi:membrane fusion protein, multidrug efflux system|nr:efflux RND transporter periplasmic adaptor subunit [Rhodospirillaceae bacterium]MBT6118907.1 efflux RND transporter periplasmic adaptor subunit [Rhodospirillaceae bacterium]
MKSSHIIAIVLAVGVAGWIVSGQFGESGPPANASDPQSANAAPERAVPRVQTRVLHAEDLVSELVLTGRTEASRAVVLRAEIAGPVVEVPVEEGAMVKEGDVIARIALDDRSAKLAEARALHEQRRIDHQAASSLAKKDFASKTRVAETKALYDAARAAVQAMEVNIGKTTIKAPFDGVLDARYVEVGNFLDTGIEVAQIVDLDPIFIVAQVSERKVGKLALGGLGTAEIITGDSVTGTVTYISRIADPETRTFRIELEVPNPDFRVVSGVTASLRLPISSARAHKVSPAVLTLDDSGRIGVKSVDEDNVVRFHPVTIAADETDHIWLSGLPESVRLIVVGQEYVQPGMKVQAIDAGATDGATPESGPVESGRGA